MMLWDTIPMVSRRSDTIGMVSHSGTCTSLSDLRQIEPSAIPLQDRVTQ